jgi:hypothetical protein
MSTGPDDAPVLPDQTLDDTDAGWGEAGGDPEHGDLEHGGRGSASDDERYLRERPPHWE